uniref:Neural proliferation differentiation and control protein 1 n=1 Tax=Ditylenchus dipsaci TaxID=166011 RepID=A0A915EIH0_9BILA
MPSSPCTSSRAKQWTEASDKLASPSPSLSVPTLKDWKLASQLTSAKLDRYAALLSSSYFYVFFFYFAGIDVGDCHKSMHSQLPHRRCDAAQQPDALQNIVEELNQQQQMRISPSDVYDEQPYEQPSPQLHPRQQTVANGRLEEHGPSSIKSQFRQRQQEVDSRATAEIQELQRLGNKFKELTQENIQEQEPSFESGPVETPSSSRYEKPLSAQKKGQSEYVEFIEPVHAKKLKNMEFMEKRLADSDERMPHHSQHYRAFNLVSNGGNIIFIAFVTMCCVFSVVGVVGGMYYYNHVKTAREDPFDDFTRYSPAGPGRDKLKKGDRGGNAFGGEKGDESLAYKAQLHHYQQTKQKIIGEQAGAGQCDVDASDKSDDEADLEHNFSVYECPGLAPTGDIEVQNPNFIESPNSGSKKNIMSP